MRILVPLLMSCAGPSAIQAAQSAEIPAAAPVTLEEAMADPDWIARSPRGAHWSQDGTRVYYSRETEDGTSATWVIDLASGEQRELGLEEEVLLEPRGGDWNETHTMRLLSVHGDLFVDEPGDRGLVQLTRTAARESSPRFLVDERWIAYQRDGVLLIRDLESGFEMQPAEVVFRDAPKDDEEEEEEPEGEFLEEQQARLFPHFERREERRDAARERRDALSELRRELVTTDMPEPFYLGRGRQSVGSDLSPDGRWMLVRVQKESRGDDAKRDQMPEFVTESSWVETSSVRGHVGTSAPRGTELVLLDIEGSAQHELDLKLLPGILEDPLAWLRDEEPTLDAPRPVSVSRVRWAPDASTVALALRSSDYKDLWIARVDLATAQLEIVHHLHDEAWINRRFSEMGWRDDASGLWFVSEQSGWAQLYLWDAASGDVGRLTDGDWEVSSVRPTPDGTALVFRGNREHPGIHEIYRVGFDGGAVERLTTLGGKTSGSLSPDGSRLLLTHSNILEPDELYVQDAVPGAEARRLTHTVEPEFSSRSWTVPEVVEVPSRNGGVIHARVYLPDGPADGPRPAVCFVHGAGYLQNAHHGWSSYSREFLFHQLLVARGYVVLDADYRASAGYGRDWRTAIYRDMGRPELEDYEDCVQWLAEHHDVDPARVGVYGGSYGGFVTLMAMFQKPQLFAAGAALRPVTDWAHYHHSYTAPILNTPQQDPEAYARSSPIEFAEGLENALLICHGMVDNNVLAKDSIRLAQRLIELGKDGWEMALYPIEPHAFRESSSWLDEYRRILELFEEHLR